MKLNSIVQLFVADIPARHQKSIDAGSSFVRIPTTHLAALLELLGELEQLASVVGAETWNDDGGES